MRAFTRLRLAALFDVERQPIRILGLVLSGVVFLGALGVAAPLRKDSDGLTAADRALCAIFEDSVCFAVARLATDDLSAIDFLSRGFRLDPNAFVLLSADCSFAARYYQQGCDGGDAGACTGLGFLHEKGIGMGPDSAEAERLYRQGCDGGDAPGCTNLGYLHLEGIGMDPDPAEAARLYRRGCDGGDALGCNNLGYLYEQGIGMDPDPAEAARLYRQDCDSGGALGCTLLGRLHQYGIGMDPDPAEAAQLYRQGCELGHEGACGLAEAPAGN